MSEFDKGILYFAAVCVIGIVILTAAWIIEIMQNKNKFKHTVARKKQKEASKKLAEQQIKINKQNGFDPMFPHDYI